MQNRLFFFRFFCYNQGCFFGGVWGFVGFSTALHNNPSQITMYRCHFCFIILKDSIMQIGPINLVKILFHRFRGLRTKSHPTVAPPRILSDNGPTTCSNPKYHPLPSHKPPTILRFARGGGSGNFGVPQLNGNTSPPTMLCNVCLCNMCHTTPHHPSFIWRLLENLSLSISLCFSPGQERYKSLASMYYRGAAAALVVYEITSRESFERAKYWVCWSSRSVCCLSCSFFTNRHRVSCFGEDALPENHKPKAKESKWRNGKQRYFRFAKKGNKQKFSLNNWNSCWLAGISHTYPMLVFFHRKIL